MIAKKKVSGHRSHRVPNMLRPGVPHRDTGDLGRKAGNALTYIQSGTLCQHGKVEGYNRTIRREWLDLSSFDAIAAAQSIPARENA